LKKEGEIAEGGTDARFADCGEVGLSYGIINKPCGGRFFADQKDGCSQKKGKSIWKMRIKQKKIILLKI
jgi:hypothetical protein